MGWAAAITLTALAAIPAEAQDGDEPICAERPGLGTPPCATPAGRMIVEAALVDWTLTRDGVDRTDTVVAGDMLVRIGLKGDAEVQIGWTAIGYGRERCTDGIDRKSGIGDVAIGALKQLVDGDTASISALGRVTLPTGGSAIGAGDWGAALLVPVEVSLGRTLTFELTPSVSAAVDADRQGRHPDYGMVAGMSADLGTHFAAVEIAVDRDLDPAGDATPLLVGLSGAWRPDSDLQIDGGVNLGLNDDADDVRLYLGVARRF